MGAESVDWAEFRRYLEEAGLSKKRVEDYVRYAKWYGYLLEADINEIVKTLLEMSVHKRQKVLAALTWLAEYQGRILEWEEKRVAVSRLLRRRRRLEVTGNVTGYPGFLEGIVERLRNLTGRERLFALTMFYTGLRPGEARAVWRGEGELLDDPPRVELHLERRTKRAYIALMPKELKEILETIRCLRIPPPASRRMNKHLEPYTLYDLRRAHATILAASGVPRWAINLLQGRSDKDVFMEHYNRVELKTIYSWYLEAFKPYLNLLSSR